MCAGVRSMGLQHDIEMCAEGSMLHFEGDGHRSAALVVEVCAGCHAAAGAEFLQKSGASQVQRVFGMTESIESTGVHNMHDRINLLNPVALL